MLQIKYKNVKNNLYHSNAIGCNFNFMQIIFIYFLFNYPGNIRKQQNQNKTNY